MNEVVRNTLRFVLLMLLQVFLLSNINLFGYAMGFIYIFFILFLPVYLPKWQVLLFSALAGLCADILLGTAGLHTAAASLLGFVRPLALKLVTPQYGEDDDVFLNIYRRKGMEFSIYALYTSFIFCTTYFFLERLGTRGIGKTLLYILGSTLFTFVTLIIFRYFFVGRNNSQRY